MNFVLNVYGDCLSYVTTSLIMHLITVLDCVWFFLVLIKHDKVCKLSHDWFPVLTFTSMLEGKCPEAGCGVMKAFLIFHLNLFHFWVFLLFKKKDWQQHHSCYLWLLQFDTLSDAEESWSLPPLHDLFNGIYMFLIIYLLLP